MHATRLAPLAALALAAALLTATTALAASHGDPLPALRQPPADTRSAWKKLFGKRTPEQRDYDAWEKEQRRLAREQEAAVQKKKGMLHRFWNWKWTLGGKKQQQPQAVDPLGVPQAQVQQQPAVGPEAQVKRQRFAYFRNLVGGKKNRKLAEAEAQRQQAAALYAQQQQQAAAAAQQQQGHGHGHAHGHGHGQGHGHGHPQDQQGRRNTPPMPVPFNFDDMEDDIFSPFVPHQPPPQQQRGRSATPPPQQRRGSAPPLFPVNPFANPAPQPNGRLFGSARFDAPAPLGGAPQPQGAPLGAPQPLGGAPQGARLSGRVDPLMVFGQAPPQPQGAPLGGAPQPLGGAPQPLGGQPLGGAAQPQGAPQGPPPPPVGLAPPPQNLAAQPNRGGLLADINARQNNPMAGLRRAQAPQARVHQAAPEPDNSPAGLQAHLAAMLAQRNANMNGRNPNHTGQ